MFEQSTINAQRKPWSFAASLTLQSAIASALIAASVAYTETIAIPVLHMPLPFVPPASVVKIVDAVRATAGPAKASLTQPRPFVEPSRVPEGIAEINEVEAPAYAIAPPGLEGFPSGVAGSGPSSLPGVSVTPAVAPPPTPSAVKTAKPTPVGGKVLEAMIVKRVVPAYPQLAKQARIAGTVRLIGVIARDGTVQKLEVLSGHPMLVASAVDAVRQWLYRPTLLNGEPVEVIAPIEVNFTLTH